MILNLFRRTPREDTIAVLYGAIVAQARDPAFYRNYGVPDTSNGRLEMIVLHTILVLSRLETEAGSGPPLGQALFDYFCGDVDANLREQGVGDMAVPRKMKAVAEAFYGRKRAYETALAAQELGELAAALTRNAYAGAGEPADADRLAVYVRAAIDKLAAIDGAALLRGQVAFPDPATVVAPQPTGAP
jgi:cytochrome b pre-mRNA-processing protein 3